MNTYSPIGENQLCFVPRSWVNSEGCEAEAAPINVGPMAIFTGEDDRVGCFPDDFEGALSNGWFSSDEIEDASYRLLCELLYDRVPVTATYHAEIELPNEITDEMMEIAKCYVVNGSGVDGLVEKFKKAIKGRNYKTCCLIIDFCERLREVLNQKYDLNYGFMEIEVSPWARSVVLRGSRNGFASPLYKRLGLAIWGEARFERMY